MQSSCGMSPVSFLCANIFRCSDEDPAVLSQRCFLQLRPLYIVALCCLLLLCCVSASDAFSVKIVTVWKLASSVLAGGESSKVIRLEG